MPACGSETAAYSLQSLWTSSRSSSGNSKNGHASPLVQKPQQQQQQQQQQVHRHHHHHHLHHHHGRYSANGSVAFGRNEGYGTRAAHRLLHRALAYIILWPLLWLSGWLWLCWLLLLRLPLALLGLLLSRKQQQQQQQHHPHQSRPSSRGGGRCVLVSGANTVQAVHMIRGLSRAAGVKRVVVCELQAFGLARFSRACWSYHTLPKTSSAAEYVNALREIVRREGVELYVPVSAADSSSSPGGAYFDSLARPHLEKSLGCECLVPRAAEVALIEDPEQLQIMARAQALPTPQYVLLARLSDAARLYEGNGLGGLLRVQGHCYAFPVGPPGLRGRPKPFELPPSLREFVQLTNNRLVQLGGEQKQQQWLVLFIPNGAVQFLTCTTIRAGKILANVTCRVDEPRGDLVPEHQLEVQRWLERFFAGFDRSLRGHFTFRLALDGLDRVVAISCRVGVGLAYLGHPLEVSELLLGGGSSSDEATSVPRSRAPPPMVVSPPMPACRQHRLDECESLLLYWDPLPYCAYCYLLLPFRMVVGLLRAQRRTRHKPPLAIVR